MGEESADVTARSIWQTLIEYGAWNFSYEFFPIYPSW
jgi:hypothetical protein